MYGTATCNRVTTDTQETHVNLFIAKSKVVPSRARKIQDLSFAQKHFRQSYGFNGPRKTETSNHDCPNKEKTATVTVLPRTICIIETFSSQTRMMEILTFRRSTKHNPQTDYQSNFGNLAASSPLTQASIIKAVPGRKEMSTNQSNSFRSCKPHDYRSILNSLSQIHRKKRAVCSYLQRQWN